MSLLLGGLAARRAGLGCRGSGRFFFGPASNRFVFGDAALGVFAGVVGRSHVLRGRIRTGRRRRSRPVDPGQQQALGLFSFRSEEHTSELQSLMRISYAVFCLKKKKQTSYTNYLIHNFIL